jgi:isopenicillin N synthase-like dioxygenase
MARRQPLTAWDGAPARLRPGLDPPSNPVQPDTKGHRPDPRLSNATEHDMTTTQITIKDAAADVPHRALPVMDLGPYLAGEPGALDQLAIQWRAACEGVGFMCLVNHGLPQAEIEKMEQEARRFHALPDAEKLEIRVNQHQRGFIPGKATILTNSVYGENKKLDSVECFVVATDYPDSDPNVQAGKQFYSRNQWPDSLPGFQDAVESYMQQVVSLCDRLLPVWAVSLGLKEDFFAPYFGNGYNYLRIAKYPQSPNPAEDEQGLGSHADTGFMTFLPPAKEGGLQVLDTDKTWFWPVVPEGAIILNIGWFLSRWTNDRYRATPHRVVPPRKADRYSIACFVNTSLEAEVECLPTCTSPDNPPKYPKESYWDFYQWYMNRAYTHYGKVGEKKA